MKKHILSECVAMDTLPSIVLPDRLRALVSRCEVWCSADCCGINAFDFEPLFVAPYVYSYARYMHAPADFSDWEPILLEAERLIEGLTPDMAGNVCIVPQLDHTFTRPEFLHMIAEIRHAISLAPSLVDFTKSLPAPPDGHS